MKTLKESLNEALLTERLSMKDPDFWWRHWKEYDRFIIKFVFDIDDYVNNNRTKAEGDDVFWNWTSYVESKVNVNSNNFEWWAYKDLNNDKKFVCALIIGTPKEKSNSIIKELIKHLPKGYEIDEVDDLEEYNPGSSEKLVKIRKEYSDMLSKSIKKYKS